MIVSCEECQSKFNLDAGMLKEDGSKVKCSLCGHIFVAYPEKPAEPEEIPTEELIEEELEEVALDSPPDSEAEEAVADDGEAGAEFEEALEEATAEELEEISPDELPLEEEGVEPTGDELAEPGEIEAEPEEVEPEEAEEEKAEEGKKKKKAASAKKKKRFPLLIIILVIFLLLVGGGAYVYFLAPDLIPDSLSFIKATKKEATPDPGVRRLTFKSVTGAFVQSEKIGQVFVIQGMVTNNYPKPRNFILVRGALLDDQGIVARRKMAYAGNSFSEDQIKTMSLEEIGKAMKNRQGKNRMNVNIKTNVSIPFVIVFENLPENLSEFTVEAVSSSPGR